MLLTFTNIGKDVFPAATETVLDMSQALGQDVTASAMQLGKALNDPIAGVTALRRVGVQLTDEQEKQVKAMMAVGDTAGAQKVILAELQKEFGGSAKAAGKTFAGQLAILGHAFDDIKEAIGNAILPLLGKFVDFIASKMPMIMNIVNKTIIPAIENIGSIMSDVFGAILEGDYWEAFDIISESLSDIVPKPVLQALMGLGKAIEAVFNYVKDNQAVVIGALKGIGLALAGFMAFTVITGIIAAIANPITLIIGLAALLGAAWAGNWGGIQEKTAAVIAFVQPLFQAFITNMQTLWQGLQPVFQAVGTVINAVISALTPIFQSLFSKIQGGFVNINPLINAFKTLWAALQPVFQALGVVVVAVMGIITGVIGGFVNAMQPWYTMIVGVINGLVTMLTGYVNIIVGLFTGNLDLARTGSQQVFSGLNTIVTSIITGMVATVKALISGFVTAFLGYFTKLGVDLQGTVTGIVTNVVKWFSDLPGKMVDVGKSIIQGIIDGIGQMIGALLNILSDVAAKIKNAVLGALSTEGTSGGMGVPGKALGGSVTGGNPFVVGERGPELFIPSVSGTIIPNNKLSAGITINLGGITISGNADASTVKQAAYNGVMAAARAMGAM